MEWQVEQIRGDAATFHHRELPGDGRCHAWVFDVAAPAIVLGSAQPDAHLDHGACDRHGVTVARRRSGGGSVLLVPGEIVWIDLVIPPGHPRWDDDVTRSAWWVGDLWRAVVADFGVSGATVHPGRLLTNAWSPMICFAGVGPAEVVVGDSKLVGISQRRTRAGARFQTALHLRWNPELAHALLADPPGVASQIPAVATLGVDATALTSQFLKKLVSFEG